MPPKYVSLNLHNKYFNLNHFYEKNLISQKGYAWPCIRLTPAEDSAVFSYPELTFNINNIKFRGLRYLTVTDDPGIDYTCAQIPAQKSAPNAVGSIADERSFILYPNPAHDRIAIRYNGDNRELQVTVQDISGRTLYTIEKAIIGQQPYALDLKQFAPGIYIITVSDNEGGSSRFKIIKE